MSDQPDVIARTIAVVQRVYKSEAGEVSLEGQAALALMTALPTEKYFVLVHVTAWRARIDVKILSTDLSFGVGTFEAASMVALGAIYEGIEAAAQTWCKQHDVPFDIDKLERFAEEPQFRAFWEDLRPTVITRSGTALDTVVVAPETVTEETPP